MTIYDKGLVSSAQSRVTEESWIWREAFTALGFEADKIYYSAGSLVFYSSVLGVNLRSTLSASTEKWLEENCPEIFL